MKEEQKWCQIPEAGRMQDACNSFNKYFRKHFTCFQGFYCGTCITGGFENKNQASYERKAREQLPAGMSIDRQENAGTVEAPN